MTDFLLREVRASDAAAVARLFDQLGYPRAEEAVAAQLRGLESGREAVFVASDAAGTLVGVACVATVSFVNEGALRARLTAIVVDEATRGAGVGAALLRRAEGWARDVGCNKIELTTHERREDAHAFYRGQGYQQQALHFMQPL